MILNAFLLIQSVVRHSMTLNAFLLILASVVLHATWHFLCKARKPVPAFYILVSGANLVFLLPFLLTAGIAASQLPWRFYQMAALGGLCGMVCDIGLSRAYRLADISLAYPLARALPVLMTAVTTIIFGIGKAPSPLALVGMAIIMAGCVMMPMKSCIKAKKTAEIKSFLPFKLS